MDRRDFLRVAASAAVAPRLAASALHRRPPRKLKKALKYGMIRVGGSVRDRFAAARAAGFDGVELDSPSKLDRDEVLRARDATGIEIPGVVDSAHWRDRLTDPDPAVRARGVRALETALRDCRRYGGTTVLLVPGVVDAKVSYAAAWERSQAGIREVLPLARELDVCIAIENVWNHFLLSPLEAARYVDGFESPHVGWYLDVGNLVRFAWPEHWIEVLGGRIRKLDVKEYSRKKRDEEGLWKGFEVELGEGDCNWPVVMKALDAAGFAGWASAEVPGGGPARLADVARRMDAVLGA